MTNSDREVLAALIPLGFTERDPYANVYEVADAILAAGFHSKADPNWLAFHADLTRTVSFNTEDIEQCDESQW
jgi:hypothetical protein